MPVVVACAGWVTTTPCGVVVAAGWVTMTPWGVVVAWWGRARAPKFQGRVISEKKRPLPGNRGLSSELVFNKSQKFKEF